MRAPARPVIGRRTERQIYLANAIFWCVLFVYYTGQMRLMESLQTLEALSWRALLMLLAFTLCAPIAWTLLRIRDWRLPAKLGLTLVACMVGAFIYSCAQQGVWTYIMNMNPESNMGWRGVASQGSYNLITFLTWSSICWAILFGAQVREREKSLHEARALAQNAELKMLRYQINPHFLFNTLNAVSALIVTGQAQAADEMIGKLARFFRNALAREWTAKVTLAEELRVQLEYLDIELIRFPDRVRLETDLPEELARALVPHLILQPLFENAIKHGVARSPASVEIRTTVRRDRGTLIVTVDNNVNPAGTAEEQPGEGVGLANVAQRLASLYGDEASMSAATRDQRFVVELRLPLELTL